MLLNLRNRLQPQVPPEARPFLDALAQMIAADVLREIRVPRLLNLRRRSPVPIKLNISNKTKT